jgi:hypothetical protein
MHVPSSNVAMRILMSLAKCRARNDMLRRVARVAQSGIAPRCNGAVARATGAKQ